MRLKPPPCVFILRLRPITLADFTRFIASFWSSGDFGLSTEESPCVLITNSLGLTQATLLAEACCGFASEKSSFGDVS